MNMEINPRGNGACPICNFSGTCRIQDSISNSVSAFPQQNDLIELVIYSCPQFQEKTQDE